MVRCLCATDDFKRYKERRGPPLTVQSPFSFPLPAKLPLRV